MDREERLDCRICSFEEFWVFDSVFSLGLDNIRKLRKRVGEGKGEDSSLLSELYKI